MEKVQLVHRPRRNRKSEGIRAAVRETLLTPDHLISPLFLLPGANRREEVTSMPGIYRLGQSEAFREIEEQLSLGLNKFILFPAVPEEKKNSTGSYSFEQENFYLTAIQRIKLQYPEVTIITDVALDPYSTDGHDGIVRDGVILNDETIEVLVRMSIAQAEAGADIIGPSDMMDGRVGYIREALDEAGHTDVSIMAYTAKYASAFYGPFRDALESAPKAGDKKTYQMDPGNAREALFEAELDFGEGADFLMVKPALSYLDIIQSLSENFNLPIVAYNVSGEYSMIKAAGEKNWIDPARVRDEVLLSMRRAGANAVISYFAREFAESFSQKNK